MLNTRTITSRISLFIVLSIILGTSALAAAAIVWPSNDDLLNELTGSESVDRDRIKDARVAFAKEHGCKEPEATVDAIGESELGDLLLSTAIEESHCDGSAQGAAGEQGAWQVISAHWGPVPKDLHGQARQAERIIKGLLIDTGGKHAKAMARYNGGDLPGAVSIDYARRVTARQQRLALIVLETGDTASNVAN